MLSEKQITIQQKAYFQYVEDTIQRLLWIAPIIAIAEFVLMLLDYKSGFFTAHPLNVLNLAAEILLIVSSAVCIVTVWQIVKHNRLSNFKVPVIVAYRIVIMLAILLFIFTDIYVRHKAIGTYIVFLFVLEITPAYKARTNWIQFSVFGIAIVSAYSAFVSKSMNTLFGTMFVFVAFAVSTDYLRRYFIKQYENYFRADEANMRFQRLAQQSITALAGAVEAKDQYTKGHSQRVAAYSQEIAKRLGFQEEQCSDIYYIGLMHDIGKIGISDQVINKTGRLTDEEYGEIKKHPSIGYDILKHVTELPGISEGARWHHERYDGRGYPDGLSADEIPEIARIIAVADAYDAMTSKRSYRNVMAQADVRDQIAINSGKQFDPAIASIMLAMIDTDVHYKMHE